MEWQKTSENGDHFKQKKSKILYNVSIVKPNDQKLESLRVSYGLGRVVLYQEPDQYGFFLRQTPIPIFL